MTDISLYLYVICRLVIELVNMKKLTLSVITFVWAATFVVVSASKIDLQNIVDLQRRFAKHVVNRVELSEGDFSMEQVIYFYFDLCWREDT